LVWRGSPLDDLDDGIAFRFDRVIEHGTVFHGDRGDLFELASLSAMPASFKFKRHFGQIGQLLIEAADFFHGCQGRLSAHPRVDKPEIADRRGKHAAGLVRTRRDQFLERIDFGQIG
jgi:hypothetical protein